MNGTFNCKDSMYWFFTSRHCCTKTLVYLSVDYTTQWLFLLLCSGANYMMILADSDGFSNAIMIIVQRESEQV